MTRVSRQEDARWVGKWLTTNPRKAARLAARHEPPITKAEAEQALAEWQAVLVAQHAASTRYTGLAPWGR